MPPRSLRLTAFGEAPLDGLQHLRLEPLDTSAALDEDEVLVEIKAAAVGWVDLLMLSGQYQHLVEPPFTPGLEYSGVVARVGAGVSRFRPGDRVIADGLHTGPRSLGTHQRHGGFASHACAPAHALLPLPAPLDHDQGACLLGAYETAWHCLVARGRLQPGEVVLVHGASGSTGLAAVHVAGLIGATVIATGRDADKLARVAAEGADHTVQIGVEPLRERVKALTGGRGVDVVFDGVGGPLSVESLRCVRFGARYLIVGWAATPAVARGRGERGAPNANQLPTNLLLMKGLDVLGCPTAISTHADPGIRAARLDAILGWVAEGRLQPVVTGAYALDDFDRAFRARWASQHVGNTVLRP